MNKQKRARRALRERMLAEHGLCYWCCLQVTAADATVEHLVPRSRGGTNRRENLVLACFWCNWARGSNTDLTRDQIVDRAWHLRRRGFKKNPTPKGTNAKHWPPVTERARRIAAEFRAAIERVERQLGDQKVGASIPQETTP